MFSDNIPDQSENSDQNLADMETHTTVTESHTELTDSEQVDQIESEDYEGPEPVEESITLQSDRMDNTENKDERNNNNKFIRLPLSRMKVIMKTDPSVKLVNRDALLSTAKAAVSSVLLLNLLVPFLSLAQPPQPMFMAVL